MKVICLLGISYFSLSNKLISQITIYSKEIEKKEKKKDLSTQFIFFSNLICTFDTFLLNQFKVFQPFLKSYPEEKYIKGDSFMYLSTEWEGRRRKYLAPIANSFPVWPDFTRSKSILSYDHF